MSLFSEKELIYTPKVVKDYSELRENFNETDKIYFDYINALGVKNKVVADLGCGDGRQAEHVHEMGATSVIGVDINPAMISIAQEKWQGTPGIEFKVANGKETGLPSESVDLVMSNFAIHYFTEASDVFNEISRILKPGGSCVCTFNATDVAPGFEKKLYNTPMPIRLGHGEASVVVQNLIKSSDELQAAITNAGLVIEKGDVLDHPNAVVDDPFEHKKHIEKYAVLLVIRKPEKKRE